jgi:hypothetical protein
MTSAYPWLPLSVLMAERLIQKPSLRRAAGLALTLALFLLAGHAQMLYYALLFLGVYALWRGCAGGRGASIRRRLAPLAWLALAIALALLICAAQVLPTAELMAQSQRTGGPDYERAMTYSFWPWRSLTLLAPDLFGNPAHGDYWGYANYWEDCAYIGVLPLFLALYAVFRRRADSRSLRDFGSLRTLLAVVAVLSLAMALGKHSPLYIAAYKWFPGIRLFQAPARFLFLYTFAAAMLAGVGAEMLAPSAAWVRRGRLALVGGIGAAAAVLALGVAPGLRDSTFIPALLLLSLTAAAIGAWLAASPASGGKRLLAWRGAAIAIVLVDLLTFGKPLIPTAPATAFAGEAEIPSVLRVPGEPFRILTTEEYEYNTMFSRYTRFADFGPGDEAEIRALRRSLLPDLVAAEGVETAANYDPLLQARSLELRRAAESATGEAQKRLLGLINVRYLVTRAPVAGLAAVVDSPGLAVGENDAVFDRVRFVADADQVEDAAGWDEILRRGDFRADHVWLESPPMDAVGTAAGDARVDWTAAQNALSARVETPGAGYLAISETYHRGWRAWDNGEPVEVLRADYAFMAVSLRQGGQHAVELRFQPVSWTAGCAISGAALVVVLALLLWRKRGDAR